MVELAGLIVVSSVIIFARLALMQELNPFLWGFLAVVVYAAPPVIMVRRGASWVDAPWVWASSFFGLFALFVAQTLAAERKRYAGRSGPKGANPPKLPKGKPRKPGPRPGRGGPGV